MSFIQGFTRRVNSAFTLNDNRTLDIYPICMFGLVVGLIALSGWALYIGHHFSPSEFGIAGGSLFGGHGLAKKLDTDPTDFDDDDLKELGKEKP